MQKVSLRATLAKIWPFAYLPPESLDQLPEQLQRVSFAAESLIYDFAQRSDTAYLLLTGKVASFVEKNQQLRFSEEISPHTLLGGHLVLLRQPANERLVALEDCECAILQRNVLLELMDQHHRFAHAMARSFRQKHAIFSSLDHFCSRLQEHADSGVIHFDKLLADYKKMHPALHPKLHQPDIDLHAWSYALNRLPADITTTHVYLLTPCPPPLLSTHNPIHTKARRRSAWKLTPGKTMVILRDNHTDLFDFVTNLCLHAIESQKMRRKLHSADLVEDLYQAVHEHQDNPLLLQKLAEVYGADWQHFCELWDEDPLQKLWQIIAHHEDYSLYVEKQVLRYDVDAAESWSQQIRQAAVELVGPLQDVRVDIISSNSFGVRNCLSPLIHQHKQTILQWGEKNAPKIAQAHYPNPIDRLYALLTPYQEAHPEFCKQVALMERQNGIIQIEADGFTGISVELIDATRLDPSAIDPALQLGTHSRHLLVNIDYAFGRQAEDILGCLILIFGNTINSINIMGKAGALIGSRGDILLADTVLMDRSDDAYRINNHDVDAKQLALDSGRQVHQGVVLTVQGTLLQDKTLLNYYRYFWHCIGLEMEGSFYAQQIHRGQSLQLLQPDVALRFIYFVSDLPLQEGEQLSKDMDPHEFIPPLYAITRAFLKPIL